MKVILIFHQCFRTILVTSKVGSIIDIFESHINSMKLLGWNHSVHTSPPSVAFTPHNVSCAHTYTKVLCISQIFSSCLAVCLGNILNSEMYFALSLPSMSPQSPTSAEIQ